MTKDEELEAAYLAGFNASGEGYNGEYPFEHKGKNCTDDPIWCKDRDNELAAIKQALAAPPTHKTARRTDEEYREISDQVISTLVEYGAELRTADCQMQILREELAESRREVAQLKAQRQWVWLTDDEIFSVLGNLQRKYNGPPTEDSRVVFALAIEAKLKEKNT
jgi:DNA-binding transcriptional MerR regulator